jgi:hypothetical protein
LDNLLKEYPNVFLIDSLGIPPTTEVDHAIDLDLNAKLIVKTPYRHSFMENKDLEQQFNDHLDKGYVKPNKSPWGAIVHAFC